MTARGLRHAAGDERGATIVEFAMIAPVLIMTILALFDLAHTMYTGAILQGVIQKAARDSTLQGASSQEDVIDQRVTTAVRAVSPHAALAFDRKDYTSFSDVSRPEDYTDLDGDGQCDDGEPFEDVNGNGVWDSDRGSTGIGGARDAVLYTVTVTYPRMFPLASLIGISPTVSAVARTVLRNQPYDAQQVTPPVAGTCS